MTADHLEWECIGRSFQSDTRLRTSGLRATGRRVVSRHRAGEWEVDVWQYAPRSRSPQYKYAVAARHTRYDRIERLDGFRSESQALAAIRRRVEYFEGIGRVFLDGAHSRVRPPRRKVSRWSRK